MVQHYLDGMFPLRRDPGTGGLLMVQVKVEGEGESERQWVPWGVEEDGNEFMESEVLVGGGGDGTGRDGEGEVDSDSDNDDDEEEVEVHDSSPVMSRSGSMMSKMGSIKPRGMRSVSKKREQGVKVKVKVKELSRLWQYRNGKSPEETPPGLVRGPDGVVRNATM